MAAMALITDPELVIFDEPTTALDVTTQIEVLKAFKAVIRERDTTGIYVTHDLAVIAQIADRITVLRHGDGAGDRRRPAVISAPAKRPTRRACWRRPSLLRGSSGDRRPSSARCSRSAA